MCVKPVPMLSALSTFLPSSTPGASFGWYMFRTVMMTGLIHSTLRISMGLGR